MQFGSKTRGEADPWQSMRLSGVQGDAACFVRHRNYELLVGSQTVSLRGLQVHADEQVIETAPHWPREVGALYGIEKLRLVHMAAQRVCHTVVAQSAYRAVQLQGVVVELQQVHSFRQLQDVDAPKQKKRLHFPRTNYKKRFCQQASDLFSSGM